MERNALVLGAGGFIGSHMVRQLKKEGFWVRGVDLKHPMYSPSVADEFIIADLRDPDLVEEVMRISGSFFNEVYQFAADMGGASYIFSGENDADIMYNSAMINLNVAKSAVSNNVERLFYSSSACIYPEFNQVDPKKPLCEESSAYPAQPDSEYGWEKLFSERMFIAFSKKNKIQIRIARYHNVFGPEGTWIGGKEKVPAAMCRKVAQAKNGEEIEIWGDGDQTRSFLYIDECIEATIKLMRSDFMGPVNIGSEELISIKDLAAMVILMSNKELVVKTIFGEEFVKKYGHACPQGVRGRVSDNALFYDKIRWKVSEKLSDGMLITFDWINEQVLLGIAVE